MVKVKETTLPAVGDDISLEHWLHLAGQARTEVDPEFLERAYHLARRVCEARPGKVDPSCLREGLSMADILADMRLDQETIVAALLHPAIRDAGLATAEVAEVLGDGVARLLAGVSRMDAIHDLYRGNEPRRDDGAHAEKLRKMLLAMVEDVRVVLVKLAERLHALRAARDLDETARRQIASETHEVYAPLANRLGMGHIKWELEDLSFRYLEPATYKAIARLLEERRVDRDRYIARVVARLRAALADAGIRAEVTGRAKHIYSIWRKMQRKGLDYQEIYDVRALRVLVDQIPDCYGALGVVHTLWSHIPKEFDDYIATPKENGYRSLHTAVIGPEGKTLEVQIRTQSMHQESELGVAAHWRYKEGLQYDTSFEAKIAWLRQILNWQEELSDSETLVEGLRSAVIEDRVYVFTPTGEVVDLAKGATPLDFAYHIHTELGHRCRGAKVNGRMVPLTYTLQTGERVEVLSAKQGTPSRDWLNPNLGYLQTSRARSKVHHWFRLQDRDKNIAAGRACMERELQRLGLKSLHYDELAGKLNFKTGEDLLAAVGAGDVRPGQVFGAMQSPLTPAREAEESVPVTRRQETGRVPDVYVQGVGNLLTQMARCCKPLPGDAIVGYITRGRGVTIHRRDCRNVLRYQDSARERLIEVDWGQGGGTAYLVDVYIRAYDRRGLLRDITAILANDKINVIAINSLTDKHDNTADITLTLEITGLTQLGRVLAQINQLPNVMEVHRRQ